MSMWKLFHIRAKQCRRKEGKQRMLVFEIKNIKLKGTLCSSGGGDSNSESEHKQY